MTAVSLPDSPLFVLTQERIDEIGALAMRSKLGRARFCLHSSVEDPVQEMIIAIVRDSHFPPHCHPRKSESLHVVSGRLGLVTFEGNGTVTKRLIRKLPMKWPNTGEWRWGHRPRTRSLRTVSLKIKNNLKRFEIDRAVFFGLLSRIWGLAAGGVTAILIAAYFSPEIQGYYYTFTTILALPRWGGPRRSGIPFLFKLSRPRHQLGFALVPTMCGHGTYHMAGTNMVVARGLQSGCKPLFLPLFPRPSGKRSRLDGDTRRRRALDGVHLGHRNPILFNVFSETSLLDFPQDLAALQT